MSPMTGLALIVIFAIVVFVVLTQYLLLKIFYFKCAKCGNLFTPSLLADLLTFHSAGRKRLKCPICGKRSWAQRIRK